MRNILATIGGAVVLFLGLGWYLGWYSFAVKPNTTGSVAFEGEVKTDKMKEDAKKALEAANKAAEANNQPKSGDPDFMGPPTPSDAKKSSPVPNNIPGPLPGPK